MGTSGANQNILKSNKTLLGVQFMVIQNFEILNFVGHGYHKIPAILEVPNSWRH